MDYRSDMQLPTYRPFTGEVSPKEAEIWLHGLIVLKRTYRGLTRKHLLKVAQNNFAEPLTTWPFQPPQRRNWQQFYKEFKRCFVNRALSSESAQNHLSQPSHNPNCDQVSKPATHLTDNHHIEDPHARSGPARRAHVVTPVNSSGDQLSGSTCRRCNR